MKKSNKFALVFALLLAAAGTGTSVYLYQQNQQLRTDPKALAAASKQATTNEAKDLKVKVGKLMQLPGDEDPVVATVSDKEKLKDQPFFKDTANGDKILIFTAAKKAIIYRESENRLINVGPIAVTSSSVAVSVLGKDTASTVDKLKAVSDITTTTGTAATSHSKTVVYDASGSNAYLAGKVAKAAGGEVVSSLPSDETVPSGAKIIVFVAE